MYIYSFGLQKYEYLHKYVSVFCIFIAEKIKNMQQTVSLLHISVVYSFFLVEFLVCLVACEFTDFVLEHRKLFEEVMHRFLAVLVHRSLAVE